MLFLAFRLSLSAIAPFTSEISPKFNTMYTLKSIPVLALALLILNVLAHPAGNDEKHLNVIVEVSVNADEIAMPITEQHDRESSLVLCLFVFPEISIRKGGLVPNSSNFDFVYFPWGLHDGSLIQ